MKKIKIAFLQPDWEDNLGILWISALLGKNHFKSKVWIEEKNSYQEIKAYSPHIVGYSCVTGQQKWIFSSINKLKSLGIKAKIIVGGPHPTFFPELIKNSLIDCICRGEGEYAMLEYAQALERGKSPYQIKNLYFNLEGKIIKNPLRPLINNLDDLPSPDRSYYNRYEFLASNPYKIFITSRGCPFKCTFCFNHAWHNLYGNTSKFIRRRSEEKVIAEILEVNKRWGIKEIRFSDDHFSLDIRWLKNFTTLYEKKIKKPYSINARADALDEDRIYHLKKSGCRLVCFGIETGSEDLRNTILKKHIRDEQIYKTAKLLKKYKIKFLTSNIIGLPHEKAKDAWKTIKINQKIKTEFPWFSMMQYYPGTQIYEMAKAKNLLGDEYSVDKLGSYFKNDYLKQKNIGELQNIHSFSILISQHKSLEPIAKFLAKKFPPNVIFRTIFKLSYLYLTAKRANLGISRLFLGLKYYFKKIIE